MKLFGDTNQENREEKGTLHSWESALYQLGRTKAYSHHQAKQEYRATGYRENPLNLIGWPTLSEIISTLENNAIEKQLANAENPYEDLLAALVPATEKLFRSHLGLAESKRLSLEHRIAVFHGYLSEIQTAAHYYLSLQPVGQLSFQNSQCPDTQISPTTINQVLERELTIPLHQWVRGLILRLALPQNTYTDSRLEEQPLREPTTAELKQAADWINEPHFGLGSNLTEATEAMKRYRLEAQKRGDTVKTYPLEQILHASQPVRTLKGQTIDWQAWGFLPCPLNQTKEEILRFLKNTPDAATAVRAHQTQAFTHRWLRAIALRGAINTHFLEIEINQQEQTERTIINPAKEDADALASAIPELHLVVATEAAWNYSSYYWIQQT
jgi:hypothetical protein